MEIRPFLVYKSSAGSGKTYTLVKEYLKIILKDPQKIRNILAITFTNAAAAEMKERVVEALGDISALAGKDEKQWKGKEITSEQTLLDVSGLPGGVYFYQVVLGDMTYSGKMVIQ